MAGAQSSPLAQGLRGFFPGYFALVMATGIVSLAAHFCGHDRVARALLAINLAAYALLWLITLARLVLYPAAVRADLTHHARGATFLSAVAGTCVLGSQLVILQAAVAPAFALWVLGFVLWTVLIYVFFAAMTVAETKPTLEAGINGPGSGSWSPPSRSPSSAPWWPRTAPLPRSCSSWRDALRPAHGPQPL